MKLSDFLVERLAFHGVKMIFTIPGGGAMHLNDSLGKSKNVNYFCNHHEQACAIAAEGYSRTTGLLGVVMTTSGPGGTNAITGVIGQWTDSVPVLYISGQIKYETSIASCREIGLRQLGDQEINITDIVRPITKYAVFIEDPRTIKYHIDKAIFLATHGRPGPVWLDIPLNVQGAMIDPDDLVEFSETSDMRSSYDGRDIDRCLELIRSAKRPVIVAGQGIRIAKAKNELMQFVTKLNLPVVTTFNGVDLMADSDPAFMGRLGTLGDRAANFIVQNSDLYISIGSRNNIRQISYNWNAFARKAKKIIVDIDQAELKKPTLTPDISICADAGDFLRAMISRLDAVGSSHENHDEWISWCNERKSKFTRQLSEAVHTDKPVELYDFIKVFTKSIDDGDVVVAGNGSACVGLFQAAIVKKDQRMIWNSGSATMGFDVPAAIGACLATNGKRVYCIAGDGSMQMNIQELQTIVHHNLPLVIYYLNNDGYISMRQTQKSFFDGRIMGSDRSSGISFPNIIELAKAYGLKTTRINCGNEIESIVSELKKADAPVLCEVVMSRDYIFSPKLSSEVKPDGRVVSKPLEDLYPFLDREEFARNMIIETLDD
ncbi:thiamine pyrophosphate-binding protein [bacterium]|nr:thiamine pyrophosphate-binding protein [bacterium]